ncbi:SKP1-like protein 1B [Solanum tuberosum]|uniref:SKP1-like protein n=1 Tax=Solanum tuberosum TaxID=4113 RepID=M1DCG3_SOLTU|nr:PREDICTED: SKP1-like protein 1B [Solanum tuberosum]
MSSSTKFLTLKTYDGKEFVLDEVIVVRSQTIKTMVEDDCVSSVIPLPNVHSKTMTKVIEYWKKHSEEGVSKDMLMDFDKAFVKVHHSILHALILVVNFLNDKEILDMMCQEVADRIKGKTQEEIRK